MSVVDSTRAGMNRDYGYPVFKGFGGFHTGGDESYFRILVLRHRVSSARVGMPSGNCFSKTMPGHKLPQ
jgi:hypothetical protein